jgi:hypothetical protein
MTEFVVEYTIKIDREGNITNDVVTHGNSFADVYAAFHVIKNELDRQIRERRVCPYNPIHPQPPTFDDARCLCGLKVCRYDPDFGCGFHGLNPD